MTDLNCISVEWRAIALQTYSQSHIRLFLIIVIKVGKVYSSLSVGCWNTGLRYLYSLLCSRTKKPWRLPTRQVLINAQRTSLCTEFFWTFQIISEMYIISVKVKLAHHISKTIEQLKKTHLAEST